MELHPHCNHEHHHYNIIHVIVHWIYIDPMIAMLLIEVEPEPEASPFIEDTMYEPRQQGKQPPFDHVDKNPFPS